MKSMEDKLKEVLSSDEENYVLMADIVRVLALYYGVLWMGEIVNEIKSFRSTIEGVDVEELDANAVRKAVEALKEMGIISYEIKTRSSFTGITPVTDLLVKLVDHSLTLNMLASDERFRRYLVEREKVFRSFTM